MHGSFDLVLESREHLRIIAIQLERIEKFEKEEKDKPLGLAVRASIEDAAVKLPQAQARLTSLQAGMKRLNWLQWFRVMVIELAFPVALGVFALFQVSAALLPFIHTVTK